MVQITVEIATLTVEQREAVSTFILNFPPSNSLDIYELVENKDDEQVTFAPFSAASEDEDEAEPTPESVFAAVAAVVPPPPSGPVLVPTQAAASSVTAAVALPALPTNGVAVLDKNGLPWDERIHAGSRTKNADGSWRIKRGADAALVTSVEAELKALMSIPAPAATIPPPPTTTTPTAPAGGDRNAFVALLKRATDLIHANKITQEELAAAVVSAGVASLPLLGNRLDLVPTVSDTIDAMILGR